MARSILEHTGKTPPVTKKDHTAEAPGFDESDALDLDEERVEEDREFGDEAAPDLFDEESPSAPKTPKAKEHTRTQLGIRRRRN